MSPLTAVLRCPHDEGEDISFEREGENEPIIALNRKRSHKKRSPIILMGLYDITTNTIKKKDIFALHSREHIDSALTRKMQIFT